MKPWIGGDADESVDHGPAVIEGFIPTQACLPAESHSRMLVTGLKVICCGLSVLWVDTIFLTPPSG